MSTTRWAAEGGASTPPRLDPLRTGAAGESAGGAAAEGAAGAASALTSWLRSSPGSQPNTPLTRTPYQATPSSAVRGSSLISTVAPCGSWAIIVRSEEHTSELQSQFH